MWISIFFITAPSNNMQNLTFISPPTVAFFTAINHNLNICSMSTINRPWKTETYKNNKMDRNPPITAKNVSFWPRLNGSWKTETFKMDWNPFDPVELILVVFKDFCYVDWWQRKHNRWWWFEVQIPHVIERRSKSFSKTVRAYVSIKNLNIWHACEL